MTPRALSLALRPWLPDWAPWRVPAGLLGLLGLLGISSALGGLVAVGGPTALVVGIALLASAFILRDFRVGVFCLIVLFPLSANPAMPRSIAGIQGLNPLNLLLLATLAALLLSAPARDAWRWSLPRPLLWLYTLPIVLAGLNGMGHVGQIPVELESFGSAAGYLRDSVIKPQLFLVLFSLLVAAAAVRSRRIEPYLAVMLFSACAVAASTLAFILHAGLSLSTLAGEDARSFLSELGQHANYQGRLYVLAYALLLFTFAETPNPRLRLALLASMAVLAAGLALTFSRSSYIGFALVSAWFILTRRTATALMLALVATAILLAMLPPEVFQRLTAGTGQGANAISADRLDGIWRPMLPVLADRPLFGSGLYSIMWSEPMRAGNVLLVGHPHNAFLESLLDMGLVGTLLLLAFFAHMWRRFHRLATDITLEATARGFFRGAAVALLVFLLMGLSGSSLRPAFEQIFLWLAYGLALAYSGRTGKPQ